MPIYEYRCGDCGKKSSTLLASYDSADPPCPACGSLKMQRLVSAFATRRGTDESDVGGDFDDAMGGMDEGYGDDLADDWSGDAGDDF